MTILSPEPKPTRLAKPMKWVFIAFNVAMLSVVGPMVYDIVAAPAAGSANGLPHEAYVPVIMAGFVWFFGTFFLGLGVGLATGKLKLKASNPDESDFGGGWDSDFDGPSD